MRQEILSEQVESIRAYAAQAYGGKAIWLLRLFNAILS